MSGLLARERVLVVDDDDQILRILVRILTGEGYRCAIARDVGAARRQLDRAPFDLILSDLNLPDESGMGLVRETLERFDGMAALMVSGMDEVALAQTAIEVGAYGYVVKPFTANEVLIAVLGALRYRSGKIDAEAELRSSQEETIHRLSMAIEARDPATGVHISHMSNYCWRIARRLKLPPQQCELIRTASPLHDIGKIAVPDGILLKPGKLAPEERAEMERHAEVGYRILTGSPSTLLQTAASIAWTHHERFDGGGYPRQLTRHEIPLEGRIAAVGDVFDALTCDRVYRKRLPLQKALEIMTDGSGTHFDPEILDTFLVEINAMEASTETA